ncbi:MAG: hypothetical protein HYW49_02995 [Deltaproteobacteria bacterium]|nr:hypothetical protein [Deltaproteobacteria bacterium]
MQVKKFEAPTMADALKIIKSELGPEAIILSTKNHRKGFGLLSRASVEVTAAISDKALQKKQITERIVPQAQKESFESLPASAQAEIYENFTGYVKQRRQENIQKKKGAADSAGGRPITKTPYSEISDEIHASTKSTQKANHGTPRGVRAFPQPSAQRKNTNENAALAASVRDTLARLDAAEAQGATSITMGAGATASEYSRNGKITANSDRAPDARAEYARNGKITSALVAAAEAGTQTAIPVAALQEDVQKLKGMLEEIKSEQNALADTRIAETGSAELNGEFQNLLRNGIDKKYATQLVKQVSFTLAAEDLRDADRILDALAIELMTNVKVEDPFDFEAGPKRQQILALLGPTGVGKTTTIAKLASQAILQKNLKVGLINVDSYKVAALDQLATYAKILNVPFREASSAAELDRALSEFKPMDLILIDTSGRSQRDAESLAQMKTLLAAAPSVKPLLIMSATTRDQELYDVVGRFRIFNPTGLVFSKLDECATYGCVYNVAVKTGLPLTYFTVGQRVPEDIELATRERLAALILDL